MSFFLQPTRGKITVAGEDVRTFEKTEWARVVSIVNQVHTQISILFNFHLNSLLQNFLGNMFSLLASIATEILFALVLNQEVEYLNT